MTATEEREHALEVAARRAAQARAEPEAAPEIVAGDGAPGAIGDAPVTRTVIRDRLELTPQFIASLNLPPQPSATSTVRLIARELVSNAQGGFGIVLENYHLDVIADIVDLGDAVRATAPSSPAAPETAGVAGPDIRVLCRELRGASLLSVGQTGGAGPKGTKGDPARFESEFNEDTGNIECLMVEAPTDGGRGGPGSPGGNSGQISLSYVVDSVPGGLQPGSLVPLGGGGGAGGEGGAPGDVHPPHATCDGPDTPPEPGPRGSRGTDGVPVPSTVGVLTAEQFFQAVRAVLGEQALAGWRAHRLRCADYFMRAFRPNDPRSIYLTLARDEATAVLAMGPTEAEKTHADMLVGNILGNVNIVGQARDSAPVPPDVEHHHAELLAYEPAVAAKFTEAIGELFATDVTVDTADRALVAQLGHLRSAELEIILQDDVDDADRALTAATQQRVAATDKADKLRAAVNQLEFEINTESPPGGFTFEQGLVIAGGVIATGLGTMFFGPVGGAAVASLIPLAGELVGNKATMEHLGAAAKSSTDLAKALHVKGDEQFLTQIGLEELLKDPDKAGKWTDPTFKMVISLAKFGGEIYKAEAKGDPRYAELKLRTAELLQAVRDRMAAEAAVGVATQDLAVANAAKKLRDDDIVRLETARTELHQQDDKIRDAVVAAVRDARSTQDLVLRRVFRAARALDVFTASHPPGSSQDSPFADLNSPDSLVAYDNGYLHPDVEADYVDQLLDHITYKQLVQQAYKEAASLDYDEAFETYLARPDGLRTGPTLRYPRVEDAAEQDTAVMMLRTTGALPFRTELTDVLPYLHEAKVDRLEVVMSGVTTPLQEFQVTLTHLGRGRLRWLPAEQADPAVAEQSLPASLDLITMRPTGALGEYAGTVEVTTPGISGIKLRCWGRAAAAEWCLRVVPDGSVKLDGLTAVDVRIGYQAFLDEDSIPSGGGIQAAGHPGSAALPGSTVTGRIDLVAPAPAGGATVMITNSDANVVKVPGGVAVPAGATGATVPIEIVKGAAPGASARLTARLGATLHTTVHVGRSDRVSVGTGTQAGLHSAVAGLAVAGNRLYGIHHFRRPDGSQEGTVPGTLLAYDTATFGTAQPRRVAVGHLPRSLAIDPARNRVYVLNGGTAGLSLTILALDSLTEVAESPVPLGAGITEVAVHPGTGEVYVGNFAGVVHVVESDRLAGTIAVGPGPFGLAVNAELGLLYVARANRSSQPHVHEVTVIRCSDRTVVDRLGGPVLFDPAQVAVLEPAASGRYVVGQRGDGTADRPVGLVLAGGGEPLVTIPTRGIPARLAVAGHLVHATIPGGLQVIDVTSPAVAALYPTGASPRSLALDPATGAAYVGDGVDGSITRLTVPALTSTPWT